MDSHTIIGMEVTDFLERMGIAEADQATEYRLEIAYRIGYEDALRNYAIWNNGVQHVGAMRKPLDEVLREFKNAIVPCRY